jgi:hypothetical protein
MTDVLISSERLLDRLGHEVLQLKKLGLVNHAAGMQSAVALVIKEIHAAHLPPVQPSMEPTE